MYIYAEQITPRLQYVVNTLFAGMEVTLTSSSTQFYEYKGPKINYSKKKFTDAEFLIVPHNLLAECVIVKPNISCTDWNDLPIFFQTKGEMPFDVFAASFFLLSRYEEYLPHKKDSYGRFAHEESLAFKEGFLKLPLVNLWKDKLFGLLRDKFREFKTPYSTFSFLPTYDIDIAYAYKGKSLVRKLVSKLKVEHTTVDGKDVFDVYDWLDDLHTTHQLSPMYFFLLAKNRSEYDKNISPGSKELKDLIKRSCSKYTVGIHPSWQSYNDESVLKKEIQSLQKIAGKKINHSRQHYIQFTLPYTYRSLIEAGITDDYSMGYGSINGFRASFASSFRWYDLMKEEETNLLLHPFCYMEANSFFEQNLSAQQAGKELQHYYDVVKKVNGNLITIFHNHFLTVQTQWQPWREMYANFLQQNFSEKKESKSTSLQQSL